MSNMFKPKVTHNNTYAKLLRRYSKEIIMTNETPYVKLTSLTADTYYYFNYDTLEFEEYDDTPSDYLSLSSGEYILINTTNKTTTDNTKLIASYTISSQVATWSYEDLDYTNLDDYDVTSTMSILASYKKNNYVYIGMFPYVVKGGYNMSERTDIPNLIMPYVSCTIKVSSNILNIRKDDIVIINSYAYTVGEVQMPLKHRPKPYTSYNISLQSLLQS